MDKLVVRIPREKLAALTGSEKQVDWANSLREKRIVRREEEYREVVEAAEAAGALPNGGPLPTQEQVDAALAKIAAEFSEHTQARWWIDMYR